MTRNTYQYETSPRKIETEYENKREHKKIKKKQPLSREEIRQKQRELKQEKRKQQKNIAIIMGVFLVLLVISYRNSLITEKFNEIQDKKSELAQTQKTIGQLEVSIESSLNLKNLEKSANKKLGMKKLDNNQKVYVTIPKKDYTESAVEEIETKSHNWFENLIDKIFKK